MMRDDNGYQDIDRVVKIVGEERKGKVLPFS